MFLTLYQVDAFAKKVFKGNPAAIIPLDSWLSDELMQSIAAENNLSETAFFITTENGFFIRWFAPLREVDLCGHATLAAAHVIFNILDYPEDKITFNSRSGELIVTKKNPYLELNFPAQRAKSCACPSIIIQAFDKQPIECLQAEDYIVVFEGEQSIIDAQPNLALLEQLDLRGVAITAKSSHYDFVSRFFAPKYGINEDSVTGSAYTQLVPYWSKQLGRKKFSSKQLSFRGGELLCEIEG
ncbi:MAG: PhzF family phenazine biosynthesis protein, partial [Pseudomonadota bacterium]